MLEVMTDGLAKWEKWKKKREALSFLLFLQRNYSSNNCSSRQTFSSFNISFLWHCLFFLAQTLKLIHMSLSWRCLEADQTNFAKFSISLVKTQIQECLRQMDVLFFRFTQLFCIMKICKETIIKSENLLNRTDVLVYNLL